ncbi:MAG: FAD-dependent oxidoreductase [Gammaproteobacteria bacterium]|nr:FAD-dependent oxidoreductase [Gammaproteobacteria bacterium]
MTPSRLLLVAVVAALVAAYFFLGLGQYLSLDHFRASQAAIEAQRAAHPFATAGLFFLAYVAVTGLSVPGAVVMTLAAGAIFGLWWGTLLVSFASSLGATIAFLVSRFLLHDAVQRRFGDRLRAINAGVAKDGAFYLLGLRLVPIFPFFVINLAMALTPIPTRTFYWVSQAGMLPATLVYVNAGREIGRIDSLAGILSPGLLASLALLAVFPLIARRAVAWARDRKACARWPRPRRFDRNLVVIGAGSAGLVSAYIAAAVKARVTLVERERMGGDCLNTGCVPSKALIRTTRFLADVRRARALGVRAASADGDFAEVMERVQRAVQAVAPHDSAARYAGLGVEVLAGDARLVSPWAVEVRGPEGTRTLTTRAIVIATGGRPAVPDVPGIADVGYVTSDTVWGLRVLPPRLLVLGGGPIGCELAQCFARLGSTVTLVQRGPRLLPKEDPEIAALVMERFRAEGIDLRMAHAPLRFERAGETRRLVCAHEGAPVQIAFDQLLVATGRRAATAGLGLEALGIGIRPDGTVETDRHLRTALPSVYAAGDVAGPYQFTHTASHQAWYAAVNALFGQFRRFAADYSAIPWCTFTDPEVARVGLSEQEATARGIAYEVTTFGLEELDRAIVDGAAHGVVKVLTVPGKDRILGATIVGEHAGELITELTLAMRHGLGLGKLLSTIHVYPTWAEANRYVAGAWKRRHAPQGLLRWVGRYHAWRRGGEGGA